MTQHITTSHVAVVDDTLMFAGAFRAALGGVPPSTWYRHIAAGLIPRAEARLGKRPAWRVATVRATVAKLLAAGDPGVSTPRRGAA